MRSIAIMAFCVRLLASGHASALSQIVDDDGNATGEIRDGIVAVPLPPLPGTEEGASPAQEGETLDPSRPDEDTPLPPTDAAPPPPVTPTAGEPASNGPAEEPEEPSLEEPSGAATPEAGEAPGGSSTESSAVEAEPLATSKVRYNAEELPRPVRDLRGRLMEIARSGEIEGLRPYIETGAEETVLSFGGSVDDPIEFLKASSGDDDGIEILAILLELLEAGHVVLEPETENALYIWPYFAQARLDQLTKPQKVELFEIVTAGDYQMMLEFGAYNFYRLGITPEGRLAYFVAGD
ncbi:hypothetical protein [Fulvimarina pelagi]|nr:hypothetical protein [Fulvimarina pelagi]